MPTELAWILASIVHLAVTKAKLRVPVVIRVGRVRLPMKRGKVLVGAVLAVSILRTVSQIRALNVLTANTLRILVVSVAWIVKKGSHLPLTTPHA